MQKEKKSVAFHKKKDGQKVKEDTFSSRDILFFWIHSLFF